MEAMFCSEERYSALTIYFHTKEEKKSICDLMDELLPKYQLTPDISIKPLSAKSRGEMRAEFHDDYNQEAKPLVEELATTLGLNFLPCDI